MLLMHDLSREREYYSLHFIGRQLRNVVFRKVSPGATEYDARSIGASGWVRRSVAAFFQKATGG